MEFDNVSKSFWTGVQRKVILDRASFRVELGNSLGILAPNGQATTIINMMCGLEQPDEGTSPRLQGVIPAGLHGRRYQQAYRERELALYRTDLRARSDYVSAFARWLTDIKEYFDMPVGMYSSGMRQRFVFALLLALEFDIYLIDEGMPTATDAEFNRKAGQVLHERLKSSTVVIVSHQPQILEAFCRQAAVLRDGKLYIFETLDEAKQYYDYTA